MASNCLYFKALIIPKEAVKFVALLRSMEDNCAFDRTQNPEEGLFEFYVPPLCKERFTDALTILEHQGLVIRWWEDNLEKSFIATL